MSNVYEYNPSGSVGYEDRVAVLGPTSRDVCRYLRTHSIWDASDKSWKDYQGRKWYSYEISRNDIGEVTYHLEKSYGMVVGDAGPRHY